MFDDLIKKFWQREQEEIEKNKFRIAAMIFLAVVAIIFSASDFDKSEEIILSETPQVEEKNSQPAEDKKISEVAEEKNSAVQKVSDENIIAVVGANSEPLFVGDPFLTSEVEEISGVEEDKKIPAAENISPPTVLKSPVSQKNSAVEETFILSGTAVSDNQRTALVRRYKGKNFEGTIILQVGDALKGKKVVEITENNLILEDGEKISAY